MSCFNRLSALYMPYSVQQIPWRQRSRRQKVIIVAFFGLALALMLNMAGWVAYLCVFLHDEKFTVASHTEHSAMSINGSLT